MYVVIFRATVKHFDTEYFTIAAQMRELALTKYGCLEFHSVTEGNDEVALSYWPDEAAIKAWRQDADHLLAQQKGHEHWYHSYIVQVAKIERQYSVTC